MYSRLREVLVDFDVFVCFNGANIHPEFISSISQIKVYGCFDDPESSDVLSRPAVQAFDIAMVGNIAEIESYRNWGAKNVHWWPLGFRVDDYDPKLTEHDILFKERTVPVTLLCERMTKYRKKRVDLFASAFSQGSYYGKGWSSGFLPESKRVPLLQNSKIGVNIHNSSGPINFRTFYLPANGVMQICDNKSNLGKIFKLGTEVIGYDSIEEAIELTKYYLAEDDARKSIALAGWKRALLEYNEVACFKFMIDAVNSFKMKSKNCKSIQTVRKQPVENKTPLFFYRISLLFFFYGNEIKSKIKYLIKKLY
jgi:hypothetical protein